MSQEIPHQNFLKAWLSGEDKNEYDDTDLEIDRKFFEKFGGHPEIAELFKEAKQEGFPPLPASAERLNTINLAATSENNYLKTKPGTNLWSDLGEAEFWFMEFTYGNTSTWEGAQKIKCDHLSLVAIADPLDYRELPKLKQKPDNLTVGGRRPAIIDLRFCGIHSLGEAFSSYLKEAEAESVAIDIWLPSLETLSHETLWETFAGFSEADICFSNVSLPEDYMEQCLDAPEMLERAYESRIGTGGGYFAPRHYMYSFSIAVGECIVRVDSHQRPFRRTDLLRRLGRPVKAKKLSTYAHQRKRLSW